MNTDSVLYPTMQNLKLSLEKIDSVMSRIGKMLHDNRQFSEAELQELHDDATDAKIFFVELLTGNDAAEDGDLRSEQLLANVRLLQQLRSDAWDRYVETLREEIGIDDGAVELADEGSVVA